MVVQAYYLEVHLALLGHIQSLREVTVRNSRQTSEGRNVFYSMQHYLTRELTHSHRSQAGTTEMLLAGWLTHSLADFPIHPQNICLGMVPPTVGWTILHCFCYFSIAMMKYCDQGHL